MTGASVLICLVVAAMGLIIALGGKGSVLAGWGLAAVPRWAGVLMVAIPSLTILLSALFMVRNYVLEESFLIITRLGWVTRLDMTQFREAAIDPNALQSSIRLCGNGGLFAFVGLFRNSKLGNYRAYVTDAKNAVVLKFFERTVVISPGNPQKFVAEIKTLV